MRIENWLEKRNRSVDLIKPMILKTEGSIFNMDMYNQQTSEEDQTSIYSLRNKVGGLITELSSMVQTHENFNQ